jgi:diguanylate cyclase (GGDEF)-like protein/PAS domain S-box-containing protein
MTLRARGWAFSALCALTFTLAVHASGALRFLEERASDLRARILQREVPSDIVIVGVDARSLADLEQWPWPRRYHARLLEQLAAAGPQRVFVDIDFSSRSTPEDDAKLAEAMQRFSRGQLILPLFSQQATGAASQLVLTKPLPELAHERVLASVVFEPSADGRIRTLQPARRVNGSLAPSAAAAIAGVAAESLESAYIDYTISPSSFAFISYVDLLAGRVDAAALRGKSILIGATALELGDMLPTPVYGMQPGVVVQALAAQSLQEAPLIRVPLWLHAIVLALLSAAAAAVFARSSWRKNLVAVAGVLAMAAALDLYAYAQHRLMLEIVPGLTIVVGCFLMATLRALDYEALRAFAYSLGLQRKDALLGSIVESSTDCILCVDASGRVQMANAAGERLFACDPAHLREASLADLLPDLIQSHDAEASLLGSCGVIAEQHARRANGETLPVEIAVSRVAHAETPLYTVIIRDVSERKAHERRLQHQATHDGLTGLPNRAALTTALDAAIGGVGAGESVALLMLDLCRFKEVNDTLGHHVGDQVLREVAQRFQAAAGDAFLTRIGGDEFTIVVERTAGRHAVIELAQRLSDSLQTPIRAAGVALDLGVSIGVALYPEHAPDGAELLKRADVAMYLCKHRGVTCEFYDPDADDNSVRRLAMVSELRRAIGTDQLVLHYQPQVNLKSGRAESVEALLRWTHPQLGRVSPAEFIAVAESTDLIRPLTAWSIERALRQSVEWRAQDFAPRIAVNLSARLLQDVEFPDLLRSLLIVYEAAPGAIEIEITESAMMQDPERALRVIRAIHELGVVLSIDDFGTGFSSLGYLRDMPVHALKLDKSFVQHLQERERDRSIVSSTVRMAHELGLEVVAEGVETQWVADHLARAGYDFAQGYLYSKPVSAQECREWMCAFNAKQDSRSATIHDLRGGMEIAEARGSGRG